MSLAFVDDGPLFYDNKGHYYEFAYHELLEKYSYLADNITFMMRTKPIGENAEFTLAPAAINVISVPNFKTPKKHFTEKKGRENCRKAN